MVFMVFYLGFEMILFSRRNWKDYLKWLSIEKCMKKVFHDDFLFDEIWLLYMNDGNVM